MEIENSDLEGRHVARREVTGYSWEPVHNEPCYADLLRNAIDAAKAGVKVSKDAVPGPAVKAMMADMAFCDGAAAYLAGVCKNPFVSDWMRAAWQRGFDEARRLEEEAEEGTGI
jgi:hypothetical protein